jgi:nucleoid DNA-binding protein
MIAREFAKLVSDKFSESTKMRVNYSEIEKLITIINETACEVLSSGDEYTMPGIGKLRPVMLKQRHHYDLNKKESILVPESMTVRFTPFSAVIKYLNKNILGRE